MNERLKTHSKTQKKSADLVSNKLRIGVFQQYQMKCKSVSKKSPRYTHTVSYDYVDARNAITDTPLLRRAKQQVKYQLDWQLYDFDWGITYQYLGTRYDKDYSSYPYQTVKMGGVSLWDLAVAYPVTSHLTVRGKIANLFDKDYETVYGYQTAGREYTLSGSYTF